MCILHIGVHHMCAKVGLARLSGNLKCSLFQVHIFTTEARDEVNRMMEEYIQQRYLQIVKLMGETKTKVKFQAGKGKNITTEEIKELNKWDGYWNSNADVLTRDENGSKFLAPIQLQGTPMPVARVASELPSVEDTIDTTREDAEAQIPVAVSTPKEPGAIERTRHDPTHMPCTGPPRVVCAFMFLTSRVHLVNPGPCKNKVDRESQAMAAALCVKAASELLVRFFLAVFGLVAEIRCEGALAR